MGKKIRVLIVDDSAAIRRILTKILSSDEQIEVVGAAEDPYVARDMIKTLNPDVLTLDIEMPRMSGLEFLGNLMRMHPMPVVMCSTLTQQGAGATLDALALGAVDFVAKPTVDAMNSMQDAAREIIDKVKGAARAQVRALGSTARARTEDRPVDRQDAGVPKRNGIARSPSRMIVAIGASTGGTEAIKEVLTHLPADVPGIVIAQHVPRAFSEAFAKRMDELSELNVCEAHDGQPILSGHVYIAPGDRHLLVTRDENRFCCKLDDTPPVNRHRPSVDVLFRSVAESAGRSAVGVMLTGMGRDGAEGMKEMREAGASNIAQDENTSVVWGMPGSAWEIGAVHSLHALSHISRQIVNLTGAPESTAQREARTG
jgi:two-component system chemotaxis response regulator CheB